MSFEKDSIRNVNVHYGPRPVNESYGARSVQDLVKRAVWKFDFKNLPAAGTTNQEQVIPANSTIIAVRLIPTVNWATLTSLDVGVSKSSDGSVIDADGLVAAATTANLIKGKVTTGAGAYVGVTIGADAAEVTVGVNGTAPTAGAAILIVDYITLA